MADYVLIVDDDPDAIRLVMDVLDAMDLEGRSAPDGHRAMKLVAEAAPRAIVLDLMMPVMDGYGMIEELQKSAGTRAIPIVLISALADHNDVTLRKLPAVVAVLSKGDFSFNTLREALQKALERNF